MNLFGGWTGGFTQGQAPHFGAITGGKEDEQNNGSNYQTPRHNVR
jgi:hypothetical protein